MRLRIDPTSPSGLSVVHDTGTEVFVTGSSSSGVQSIVAGANVTVDNTDPANPIISATGEGGTTDHASLTHLAYEDSGHTGFQPAGSYLTDISGQDLSTADNTTSAFITAGDIPAIPDSVDDLSPSQTGNNGKFLKTDGTNATWESIPGGGDMLASVYDPAAGAKQVAFSADLGSAALADTGDFATAAQGDLADTALQAETDPVFSASEASNFVAGDAAKLAGIEPGAEVNNISDINATDLTDGGATTLHKHSYNNLDDKPTIPTRDSLGLDTDDSPQFAGINVGHASDTTISRVSAGLIAVEGNNVITSATVPVKATGAETNTGTDDAKFLTPKAVADSFIGAKDGWSSLAAASYYGADSPTYSILFAPGVLDGRITKGTKIRLTDASTTKYFIVTLIATDGGSNNIVFLYGGTDYTLSGGAVTNICYSNLKSPIGFPLDPTKWTVVTSDTTQRSQTTSGTTIYNLGGINIVIPIGLWAVRYQLLVQLGIGTASAGPKYMTVSLSTANNTIIADNSIGVAGADVKLIRQYVEKNLPILSLTAKTTYYLNARDDAGTGNTIYFLNSSSGGLTLRISAVCAYL